MQNSTTILNSTNGVSKQEVKEDSGEVELSDSELLLWSITVSIYTIGGMIGSYLTGVFVGKLGR